MSNSSPLNSLGKGIASSSLGKALAKQLGLPQPVTLRRGRTGPTGPVALATATSGEEAASSSGQSTSVVADALALLGVDTMPAVRDEVRSGADADSGEAARYQDKIGALVLDATQVRHVRDLEGVRASLRPAVRALRASGRIIVLGAAEPVAPALSSQDAGPAPEAAAAQQALEGITRSVGKELRAGATANLVRLSEDATGQDLASTMSFLLEGRSAYVSGQVWQVAHAASAAPEVTPAGIGQAGARPLGEQVVVVTGAARGIGAAIAATMARDGAHVVCLDVPAAGQALSEVANQIGGTALQTDITDPAAGQAIADHVVARYGPEAAIHAIVHNAGITRDKLLANTDQDRWASVLEVNLAAQIRMNTVLLDADLPGGLADGARIVGVASTSGIAGNRGQSNYAASKAGVIGLVRALAPHVQERGITVNAVAPGFIETEMTSSIPLATREIGRRINSMQQGGKPVDVAETIGYFADPASGAVSGQVIRVCGQSQLGA